MFSLASVCFSATEYSRSGSDDDAPHTRLPRAAACLILVLALVGCASQPGPGLALGEAPWRDGDKATYDWLDKSGNKIGTEELGFARDGSAWVLTSADRIGEALDQSARVRVDATSLKPLGGEKRVKTKDTEATVKTSYHGGKADIEAIVNGANRSATMDVPSDSLDNDQLLATLRALKFADGYAGKYVNVVPSSALKINATIRVQGKERVDVPAGSFDAWKVELDFGQAKQYAWYQVEAPNQLVKYDNGVDEDGAGQVAAVAASIREVGN